MKLTKNALNMLLSAYRAVFARGNKDKLLPQLGGGTTIN